MAMPRKHYEDDLQRDVMGFIRLQYPHIISFHVPNGGKRGPREAARLKRQGVLAGVSDILLYWQDSFAAIELKYGENDMSKPQAYFADKLQKFGGKFAVCRSVEEVQTIMKAWGVK